MSDLQKQFDWYSERIEKEREEVARLHKLLLDRSDCLLRLERERNKIFKELFAAVE